MNAFWTITIRSHSGYFSRGIHFLWGRRHCPHCYLNFGWLSVFFSFFLAICLVLHSSRFCTAVGFCAFLGFFIPFYITGKAFVYLLPFYIFYDVYVAICFSPTRLKDVGRLCHLFPLP